MKPIASPFSDRILSVNTRLEKIPFRKEEFEVVYHFYEDAGQQFTTDEADEINLIQAYNQYREKHNLPFPDDIKAIREKYQLSTPKMAEVLGFGINVYRQYESGEVPSQSNARLIQLANDPEEFRKLVLLSDAFNQKELEKILKRIDGLITEQKNAIFRLYIANYVLGTNLRPSSYNGYKQPNLQKTINVIRYLIEKLNPTKTGLNKLLFYTDFLHYRNNGTALMGLEYRAIPYGTVPSRYDSLLEYVAESSYINRHQEILSNDKFVEKYSLTIQAEDIEFTASELDTLNAITTIFKGKTATEIVNINHQEDAWLKNHATRQLVNYSYAYSLKISTKP
jgi:DNA-binding transcriptional regulator YiaG